MEEALSLMAATEFDYILIHHHDFTKVDTLKSRFPNPKYVADNANIFSDAYPGFSFAAIQ